MYVCVLMCVCVHKRVLMHLGTRGRKRTCGQQKTTLQSQFFCPRFPVSQGSKPGHLGLCGKHFYWLSHLNSPRSLYFNNSFKKFNERRSKNYEPPWTDYPSKNYSQLFTFIPKYLGWPQEK